jgi:hypothetical protein
MMQVRMIVTKKGAARLKKPAGSEILMPGTKAHAYRILKLVEPAPPGTVASEAAPTYSRRDMRAAAAPDGAAAAPDGAVSLRDAQVGASDAAPEPAPAPPSPTTPPDLVAARAEYETVVCRRPWHGWDVDTLRAKTAAARAAPPLTDLV